MLSRQKMEEYLKSQVEDNGSETDRFIKDLLIKIEFGHFEPDEDEEDTSNYEYENFR